MLKCPMCRELLPDDARQCRKCQTDLTLLTDYVSHLRKGLTQAEACTRAGELGEAVWAYLAVLEVDPDNATGRRWMKAVHKEGRYRRWLSSWQEGESSAAGFWSWVVLFLMFFGGVLIA